MGFRQSTSGGGNGSALGVPFNSNNAAGSLLVYAGQSVASTGDAFTDTNNSPAAIGGASPFLTLGGGPDGYCYAAAVLSCGSGANTATLGGAGAVQRIVAIAEYDGKHTAVGAPVTATGFGTAISAGPVTTNQIADVFELVFSGNSAAVPFKAPGSYNLRENTAGGVNAGIAIGDRLLQPAGSFTPSVTATSSSNWGAAVLAVTIPPSGTHVPGESAAFYRARQHRGLLL